jgi:hypothetical protein
LAYLSSHVGLDSLIRLANPIKTHQACDISGILCSSNVVK